MIWDSRAGGDTKTGHYDIVDNGTETPPHKCRGVLIDSPSVHFCFGVNVSQFRAVSGSPSTGRASRSRGTCPLIRQASPAADSDRSYPVSMSMPATVGTDIGAVLRLIAGSAGRAFLARIGRVYLLYLDAKPLRLVGDEHRQLIEAPTVFHAVVFAGRRPTTCACRALAYSCKRFDFDRTHPLRLCMVHDLAGKLVVDILHPPRFFALAFPDGTGFLRLVQGLAAAVEATAHHALITSIAVEADALPAHIGDRRHFDAQVNAHHALRFYGFRFREGHGDIGDPLASLLLDAQDAWESSQRDGGTADRELLHLAIQRDGYNQDVPLDVPVLIVPLANGLLEDGQYVQIEGTRKDGAGIAQGLIFDARRQSGSEVFGAEGVIVWDEIGVQGRGQHIDRTDIFQGMFHEQATLFGCWIQAHLVGLLKSLWFSAHPSPLAVWLGSQPKYLSCISSFSLSQKRNAFHPPLERRGAFRRSSL